MAFSLLAHSHAQLPGAGATITAKAPAPEKTAERSQFAVLRQTIMTDVGGNTHVVLLEANLCARSVAITSECRVSTLVFPSRTKRCRRISDGLHDLFRPRTPD